MCFFGYLNLFTHLCVFVHSCLICHFCVPVTFTHTRSAPLSPLAPPSSRTDGRTGERVPTSAPPLRPNSTHRSPACLDPARTTVTQPKHTHAHTHLCWNPYTPKIMWHTHIQTSMIKYTFFKPHIHIETYTHTSHIVSPMVNRCHWIKLRWSNQSDVCSKQSHILG